MPRLPRLYYLLAVISHAKKCLALFQLASILRADMPTSLERLKREHELRGWSQSDLAAQLEVSDVQEKRSDT